MSAVAERLGKRRFALPTLAALLLACILSLVFYPMTHMEARDLPFAILNLDEGATTPAGEVNAGQQMAENLVAAPNSAIEWTVVESQEELDAAMENNEYYGAVVIPQGFTAAQLSANAAGSGAADSGTGQESAAPGEASGGAASEGSVATEPASDGAAAAEADGATAAEADGATAEEADGAVATEEVTPAIQVLLDNAKSPLVASQMSTLLPSMFSELGVEAQVQTVHAGASSSATNPLLSQQLSVMPLVILSLIASVLTAIAVAPLKGTAGAARRGQAVKQLITIVVTSAVIALIVWMMVTAVGNFDLPAGAITFFWLASAALMALFVGLLDLWALLGALIAVAVFALGMPSGPLPAQMLPSFWQTWVYPWAPQHFIGDGVRDIAYMGAGAWPAGATQLAVICGVGLLLLIVAAFIGRDGRNADAAVSGNVREQAPAVEDGQPADLQHTA